MSLASAAAVAPSPSASAVPVPATDRGAAASGAAPEAPEAREAPLAFAVDGEPLLGILSLPPAGRPAADTGVLIVVGGPQVRAGSHRQFVLLARHLAAAGHATLRFDVRGMGDSPGAQRDFEHIEADIGAAIDALLEAVPGLQRVVLWGLCDGASAALLYRDARPQDGRVAGLALLNPWVRTEAGLARTHVKHYYLQRLRQGSFWRKLLGGQVARSALTGLWRNLAAAFGRPAPGSAGAGTALPYTERMARAWAGFGGPILLLLSADDLTAREFIEHSQARPEWQHALRQRPPQRLSLAGADHTCSQPEARAAAEAATAQWLATHFGAGR